MQVLDDPAIQHRHALAPRPRLGIGRDLRRARSTSSSTAQRPRSPPKLRRVDQRLAVEPHVAALLAFRPQPASSLKALNTPSTITLPSARAASTQPQPRHQRQPVGPEPRAQLLGQVVGPHDHPLQPRMRRNRARVQAAPRRLHHRPQRLGRTRPVPPPRPGSSGPFTFGTSTASAPDVRKGRQIIRPPGRVQPVDPHDPRRAPVSPRATAASSIARPGLLRRATRASSRSKMIASAAAPAPSPAPAPSRRGCTEPTDRDAPRLTSAQYSCASKHGFVTNRQGHLTPGGTTAASQRKKPAPQHGETAPLTARQPSPRQPLVTQQQKGHA
jgi:hypothetical protein